MRFLVVVLAGFVWLSASDAFAESQRRPALSARLMGGQKGRPKVGVVVIRPRPVFTRPGYARPPVNYRAAPPRYYSRPPSYGYGGYRSSVPYARRSSYERRSFGFSRSYGGSSGYHRITPTSMSLTYPVIQQPLVTVPVAAPASSLSSPDAATSQPVEPLRLEPPPGSIWLDETGWIVPEKVRKDRWGRLAKIEGRTFPLARGVKVKFDNGQVEKIEYDD